MNLGAGSISSRALCAIAHDQELRGGDDLKESPPTNMPSIKTKPTAKSFNCSCWPPPRRPPSTKKMVPIGRCVLQLYADDVLRPIRFVHEELCHYVMLTSICGAIKANCTVLSDAEERAGRRGIIFCFSYFVSLVSFVLG